MRIRIEKQYLRTFETLEHKSSYHRMKGAIFSLAKRSYANKNSQDYPDPSDLSIGDGHCLNRQEVEKFIAHLQSWLDTGRLSVRRKTGE